MKNNIKKCSFKKHSDIDAITYCKECNVFMCNKCLNSHPDFLENHHKYNIDKNFEDIFTGICHEENHKNELEYFCNDHNQLCCVACICKIRGKGNGQHSDCNICFIDEIKEEKKSILEENIKNLEDLSNTIESSIKELKKILIEINNNKEQLKMEILKKFTVMRNIINEREDKLLSLIDNTFNDIFLNENDDIIKPSEKLPKTIKEFLEIGKNIIEKWDNNDIKLNSKINDCIKMENSIEKINELNEQIKNYNNKKPKIVLENEDNNFNTIIKKIKEFGIIIDQNEKLDEEGLEKEAIETVMNEGKCSRQVAIKALRAHNGDPVEALLEVGY